MAFKSYLLSMGIENPVTRFVQFFLINQLNCSKSCFVTFVDFVIILKKNVLSYSTICSIWQLSRKKLSSFPVLLIHSLVSFFTKSWIFLPICFRETHGSFFTKNWIFFLFVLEKRMALEHDTMKNLQNNFPLFSVALLRSVAYKSRLKNLYI